MISKLMIVQWSGPLPDWTDRWLANTHRVTDAGHGWHFLLDHNIHGIRRRIESLGVTCPPLEGRKLCDYRPALGEMYADEVAGFDFWGHTDLDCVYGPLWDYVTDELLDGCDAFSNDAAPDMCGPFSLYRTATASHVFRQHEGWQAVFEDPAHHAFDETGIAPTLARSPGLVVTHRHWEGADSMYVHFHRPKVYPDDLYGWPWTMSKEDYALKRIAELTLWGEIPNTAEETAEIEALSRFLEEKHDAKAVGHLVRCAISAEAGY